MTRYFLILQGIVEPKIDYCVNFMLVDNSIIYKKGTNKIYCET